MGKKTNPIVLRMNKTYHQKSKYIEKKPLEHNFYSFRNIEIQNFIKQFFKNYGLMIHDLRLCFFNKTLSIFVSYFSTIKTNSIILNKINTERKVKVTRRKIKPKYKTIYTKLLNSSKKHFRYRDLNSLVETKRVQSFHKTKQIRPWLMQNYNNYFKLKNHKNVKNVKLNNFLQNFFKSLSLFTNNKFNLSITLKQFNGSLTNDITKKNIKTLNKSLVKLRRYQDNKFFKDGLNIMFLATTNRSSANLLASFITNELQKLKRHNFFIRFIKKTLTLFNNKAFSKINGIKIKIKGRFNRAPRARHKIIKIGNGVSVLNLSAKIDYSESVAFTSNGTLGVKVWICEGIVKIAKCSLDQNKRNTKKLRKVDLENLSLSQINLTLVTLG